MKSTQTMMIFFYTKKFQQGIIKDTDSIFQEQPQPAHKKCLSMIMKALFSKIVVFKEHKEYKLKGGHLFYLLLRAF